MRVLIAIDDSKFSQEALTRFAGQIRPEGSEIRILHVVQPIATAPIPQMDAHYTPEIKEQMEKGRELVQRAASTLRGNGFKVETAVEKGDIRMRIVDTAAEWPADLIVVGSHGRTGLQRLLLGSVAEFVARHAPCSVEIVRASTQKP